VDDGDVILHIFRAFIPSPQSSLLVVYSLPSNITVVELFRLRWAT
jgi:hypothetical protein